MSARMLDARFAGGPLTVNVGDVVGRPVVRLSVPSPEAGMLPDEARTLAVALIEAAARAEQPESEDWP